MLIKAEQKNTRYSPRKARLVANAVKDLPLDRAVEQLGLMSKKGSEVILKVLRQAMANATHNFGLSIADLEIDTILINQGPMYKRFRAVSRGRAHTIIKQTCHVRVILKTKENVDVKTMKPQKASAVKATKVTSDKGTEVIETGTKAKVNRVPKVEKAKIEKGAMTAKKVMTRTTSK